MSPRRNWPKGSKRPAEESERPLLRQSNVDAPPGWTARTISAERAIKNYRCPYCNQDIRPGTVHVVAWRDGDDDLRRHWHTPCWGRDSKSIR